MKFSLKSLSLAAFSIMLLSCSKSRIVSSVEKESLFTLNYGNFEDELNLFDFAHSGEINTSPCVTVSSI